MMSSNKIEKAIILYQKAIALKSPKTLPAWIYKNLADALYQNGNIDKAIAFYQQAIKLQPDAPVGYLGLGQTLLARKKWQNAIKYFQKVLNKNPSRKIIYEIVASIGRLKEKDLSKLLDSVSNLIEIFPQSSTPMMYRKIASYYDLEYYYLKILPR